MKIYKLTYEEIDTEDKYSPEKNIKLCCQKAFSDFEVEMLGFGKYDAHKLEDFRNNVMVGLFKQIR